MEFDLKNILAWILDGHRESFIEVRSPGLNITVDGDIAALELRTPGVVSTHSERRVRL